MHSGNDDLSRWAFNINLGSNSSKSLQRQDWKRDRGGVASKHSAEEPR